jgi:hypothetical protein
MNLLLALFLIIFEAVYEGIKTAGYHVASEIVEFVYLAGITFGLFAWINSVKAFDYKPLVKILIGYVLLRFAIFDIIWNISAGREWYYYGVTKFYDKIMMALGSWGWMVKAIAGVWGISWLLGWQDGIKRAR